MPDTLPLGAYEAACAAGPGSQDPLLAGLAAAAPLIRDQERERIVDLFDLWIEITMSEPNSHPPSAWKAGFRNLIKIGSEEGGSRG